MKIVKVENLCELFVADLQRRQQELERLEEARRARMGAMPPPSG